MSKREHWSGKIAFILAATGSAVGLGNLWKFPYIAWHNGGGLFVLTYLFFIVVLGLPIMISEIALGKMAGRSPVGAFKMLHGNKSPFRFVGHLGVLTAFLLLSYYSVVAGWSFEYVFKAGGNDFGKLDNVRIEKLLEKQDYRDQVAHKSFTQAFAGNLSDGMKVELLHDADLPFQFSDGEKLNQFFSENQEKLPDLLLEKGKLKDWEDRFFVRQQADPGYGEWLKESLMSAHSSEMFGEFLSDKSKLLSWHTIIMLITILIVAGGIKRGIELAVRIFMPLLIVIMLILMVNSLMLDKEQEGIRFLIHGDPGKFNSTSIIEALGHAFFTLSLGMGVMMTYGSYMSKRSDVVSDSMWVTGSDTFISLTSSMMIFPIIFVYGMQPTSGGIGILFTTLPLELMKFPGGAFLTVLFYVLVFLAAITSAISLLEVVVTYLVDERNMRRYQASLLAGLVIFVMGIPSALSVDGFLGVVDKIVSNVLLPLGGLLIAIFVGWFLDPQKLYKEFDHPRIPAWIFPTYRIFIRFLTPVLIFYILADLVVKMVSGGK